MNKLWMERLHHSSYADYIVLLTNELREVKTMFKELKIAWIDSDLKVDLTKRKYKRNLVFYLPRFQNSRWWIKLIDRYVYLGHEISIGKDNETTEVSRRIADGWMVYRSVKNEFKPTYQLIWKVVHQCVLLDDLRCGGAITCINSSGQRLESMSASSDAKTQNQ